MPMNLSLDAMSLELPRLRSRHPNRLPFRGVLTLLDVPSDRAPAGARGHRVLMTRAAAEISHAAAPRPAWNSPTPTPSLLTVRGYIFARDFPEVVRALHGRSAWLWPASRWPSAEPFRARAASLAAAQSTAITTPSINVALLRRTAR